MAAIIICTNVRAPSTVDMFPSSSWTMRLGALHNRGVEPAGRTTSTCDTAASQAIFWQLLLRRIVETALSSRQYPHMRFGARLPQKVINPARSAATEGTTQQHTHWHCCQGTLSPGRLGSPPKSPSSSRHLVDHFNACNICAHSV